MKARRREQAAEDFQMTPMIDMVFLLLVFFMCVSSLAQADKRIPVDLPESAESKVPEDLTDRGWVTVAGDGRVYLGAAPVAPGELKERLRAELVRRPGLRVLVRAEKEVAFAEIRRVLRACAEAGAAEIIYATVQVD